MAGAIHYDAGRIFSNAGEVINATTGATLGQLGAGNVGYGSQVLVDSSDGRAYAIFYNYYNRKR